MTCVLLLPAEFLLCLVQPRLHQMGKTQLEYNQLWDLKEQKVNTEILECDKVFQNWLMSFFQLKSAVKHTKTFPPERPCIRMNFSQNYEKFYLVNIHCPDLKSLVVRTVPLQYQTSPDVTHHWILKPEYIFTSVV